MSIDNYAGELEKAIKSRHNSNWYPSEYPRFFKCERRLLGVLKTAHHFVIPEGGKLFNDGLKGLSGIEELRLPYPAITVSSLLSSEKDQNKRLIIAFEVPDGHGYMHSVCGVKMETINQNGLPDNANFSGPCIAYHGFDYVSGMTMPWAMTTTFGVIPVGCSVIDYKGGVGAISSTALIDFDEHFDQFARELSIDPSNMPEGSTLKIAELVMHEAAKDSRVLLELLEALSCANVTHEPTGVPRRRLAGKRAPLYQSRTLLLNRPEDSSRGQSSQSKQLGQVRAHLRRGHIRRLSKGNIWVNACAVGNIKNGFLHKDYNVKSGE